MTVIGTSRGRQLDAKNATRWSAPQTFSSSAELPTTNTPESQVGSQMHPGGPSLPSRDDPSWNGNATRLGIMWLCSHGWLTRQELVPKHYHLIHSVLSQQYACIVHTYREECASGSIGRRSGLSEMQQMTIPCPGRQTKRPPFGVGFGDNLV